MTIIQATLFFKVVVFAANVIIGEFYALETLYWAEDIILEVSEPDLAKNLDNEPVHEGIYLRIKLDDGTIFICYPNAGESRQFHGSSHLDQRALEAGSIGSCSTIFREMNYKSPL